MKKGIIITLVLAVAAVVIYFVSKKKSGAEFFENWWHNSTKSPAKEYEQTYDAMRQALIAGKSIVRGGKKFNLAFFQKEAAEKGMSLSRRLAAFASWTVKKDYDYGIV